MGSAAAKMTLESSPYRQQQPSHGQMSAKKAVDGLQKLGSEHQDSSSQQHPDNQQVDKSSKKCSTPNISVESVEDACSEEALDADVDK